MWGGSSSNSGDPHVLPAPCVPGTHGRVSPAHLVFGVTGSEDGVPAMLCTHGLRKEFRGFVAVDDVDLRVAEGSVHALVGPNGAGKTTLFNVLSGVVAPSAGRVELAGRDVTGLPPELTAREHVELALAAGTGLGWRFWRSDRRLHRYRDRALDLLGEVGLAEVAEHRADALAYGRKRALELAVALALGPRVLLLDEPTAGMGAEDVDRTVALVRRAGEGRTV